MNTLLCLRPENIDGGRYSGLGTQLASIVRVLARIDDFEWYVADLEPGASQTGEGPLRKIGNSTQMQQFATTVDQFLRGVFLATKQAAPQFRPDIDTEDPADADLGDAAIEVRAFDTSYFEVLTKDSRIASALCGAFKCSAACT